MMTGVLAALKYLHERGIAHLDIKETNILICQRKGYPTVYDPLIFVLPIFSRISKNYKPKKRRFHDRYSHDMCLSTKFEVKMSPGRCGTHTRIAPELLLESCDGRIADMWSAGCVFVNMVIPSSCRQDWDASFIVSANQAMSKSSKRGSEMVWRK